MTWTFGTIRTCPPAETIANLKRIVAKVGISRVANVTWLDEVGLPTWMVVRPLARSLSVSQGKGLTDELALCSGLMESIELHHAETYRGDTKIVPLGVASKDANFANIAELTILPSAEPHSETPVEWAPATDLLSGREAYVPWELFDLDFAKPVQRPRLFVSSSNGLASGNTRSEAILHGLCEVIERDQVALWVLRRLYEARRRPTLIDPSSIDDPILREIIAKCSHAGLSVYVWYCTEDLKLPTFKCAVVAPHGSSLFLQPAGGSGTHPHKSIALARAVTEALQSRLTHIAGARDDLYWNRYRTTIPSTSLAAGADPACYDREETVSFRDIPDGFDDISVDALVVKVLQVLTKRGLKQAFYVDLSDANLRIPVVFITVPCLEGNIVHSHYIPNARALAFLESII
jgi:ribosomal protein S12 methylthiotransferase accessory factor